MSENIYMVYDIKSSIPASTLILKNLDGLYFGVVDTDKCINIKKKDIVAVEGKIYDKKKVSIKNIRAIEDVGLKEVTQCFTKIWSYQAKYQRFLDILNNIGNEYCRNIVKELFLLDTIIKRFPGVFFLCT